MDNLKHNFRELLKNAYPQIDINSLGAYCDKFEKIIEHFNSLGIKGEDKKKNILSNIGKKDYLNYVCELSIIYYFSSKFPRDFKSEICVDGKNFDFSFFNNELRINVEVKSLSPSMNSGRIPIKLFILKEQEHTLYEQGLENLTRTTYKKITELLNKADQQLPSLKENEINIVFLCVSDLDEYSDVITNLLHSKIGILEHNAFSNIDCILVCNIGFEHNFLLNKTVYENYMKNVQEYNLNGELVWEYERSAPVLPMLFWLKTTFNRGEKIQKSVMEATFSHTCYLRNRVKNNDNIQKALFSIYNEISLGTLTS